MDGQSSTGDRWFALRCDARWENMPVVDADRAVRRCERCERTVHLCRTVAQFEGHARHGNCVAVLESGPFARVVTNSCEAPQAPEDAPSAENPFDPLDADVPRPPPPQPPREVWIPTAGVPRKPARDGREP
jgi:hypothetical protein